MMRLCDDDHDEICYDSRDCPLCEKQKEVDRLQEQVEELRDEIKELKEDL
jgi:polyhydroxyalkanoate synthesis regulator phasin